MSGDGAEVIQEQDQFHSESREALSRIAAFVSHEFPDVHTPEVGADSWMPYTLDLSDLSRRQRMEVVGFIERNFTLLQA